MWIAIADTDLLTVLAGAELSAFRSAALAAGQADPVAETVTNVVNEVRGYIAAYVENLPLGPEGTLPDKLISVALDMLAVRIPMRVGQNPKEGRERANARAERILNDVARGKFRVEAADPTTASTEQLGVIAPTIGTAQPLPSPCGFTPPPRIPGVYQEGL